MHNYKRIRYSLLAILLFLSSKASATEYAWFDMHPLGESEFASTGMIQIGFAKDDKALSFKLTSASNCYLFCFETTEGYSDYTINYGRRYQYKIFTTTTMVGIGAFTSRSEDCDGNRNCDSKTTVGIPLSASFIVGKHLGLSVNFHANLNNIEPIAFLTFGMSIGNFR